MATSLLPAQFSNLEPFASKWCLATEAERYGERLASSMEEMQALYDAGMATGEDAIAFCDKFPLDAMPDEVVNLMQLLYSLITISFAIECWSQPRVPGHRCGLPRSDRRAGALSGDRATSTPTGIWRGARLLPYLELCQILPGQSAAR